MRRGRQALLGGVALVLAAAAGTDPVLAQTRIYVPQVIAGGQTTANVRTDFSTVFHLFNRAPETVRVRIRTFRDDGGPLPAFFDEGDTGEVGLQSEITHTLAGFAQLDSATASAATDPSGWAVIEVLDFVSGEPIDSSITAAVTLETRVRGGDTTRAALLVPSEPSSAFFAYGMIAPLTSPIGVTGMALLNPSDGESVRVTLHLVGQQGAVQESRTVELAPRTKISGFLDDPRFFPARSDFEGTVEVRSTGPVSAAAIRVGPTFWSSIGVFPGRPIPGLDGND